MHAEVFRGEGRQPWYVRLVGGNGEPMLVSEGYLTRWNAERAARKLGVPVVVYKDFDALPE
jgi:uncharacterized protein YegP (UPF0339 family)